MNVLEKILKEIEEKTIIVATSKEHYNQPQNGEFVEEVITIKNVEDIIRSHMDKLPNGIKEVSKEQLNQIPVATPEFLQECKATAEKYDKLKFYEDLEEQERLLIQAFAIETTAECPDCGYSEIMISETWIRPELLQHDRFYATRSEAEQTLKKMEEMR